MDKFKALPSSSFGSICRTCLVHSDLSLIDEVSWEGINLKEIIINWTSLEVETDPETDKRLPKQMCNNCVRRMYQTYYFLSKCKHTERILKSILLRDEGESQGDHEDITEVYLKNPPAIKDLNALINESVLQSDNIRDKTTDADDQDSVADLNNDTNIACFNDTDNDLSDSATLDTNCSVTADVDSKNKTKTDRTDVDSKIKTEIPNDDEISTECDPDQSILHEIQSIKTDITAMRAKNRTALCQRILDKKRRLQKARQKDLKNQCITCEATFLTSEELKTHKNETHKKFYKFQCPYCDNKFQNSSHLEDHIRVHTGEKPYQCNQCDASFSFKCVWKRHLVRHMKIKPHRCRFCKKEFTRKHILTQHERLHTGKRLLCRFCGKEFNTSVGLRQHERYFHPDVQKVPSTMTENGYQCDVCGKVLLSEKTLSEHVLLHGPRKFECQTCLKTFTTKERLRLHEKMTHHSEIFTCHICGNTYKHKNGLMGHLESQHEESSFVCSECGKKFVYKSSLRDHMRLHRGDPKYQCKECLCYLTNKRRLDSHIRSHHTGERPYNCEVCGKCFGDKANFTNHQKIHVKDRTYACNVCEKLFLNFNCLKKHIKEEHVL